MSDQSAVSAQMDSILNSLQNTISHARIAVGDPGFWARLTTDDYARQQVLGSIEADQQRINTLIDRQSEVLNGDMAYSDWTAEAQGIFGDLKYQTGISDQWQFSSYVNYTVSNTVNQISNVIPNPWKDELQKYAVYGMIGLAAFLLISLMLG